MWSSLVNFVSQLMGNQFGQFCHALKQGQCNKAEDMYFNTKKLREAILLKVNEPLGPEHDHNSVLHYVAQLKMQRMYVELLNSDRCPGVPDLKNGHRRNCFHLICLNDTNSHAALSMLEFTVEFLRRQKVDVAHLLAEKDKVHQVLKLNLWLVALTLRPHAERCGLMPVCSAHTPHTHTHMRMQSFDVHTPPPSQHTHTCARMATLPYTWQQLWVSLTVWIYW